MEKVTKVSRYLFRAIVGTGGFIVASVVNDLVKPHITNGRPEWLRPTGEVLVWIFLVVVWMWVTEKVAPVD